MIDPPICQQPFDGLPIWLRRIADRITLPGNPHFVALCRCDAHDFLRHCIVAKERKRVPLAPITITRVPHGWTIFIDRSGFQKLLIDKRLVGVPCLKSVNNQAG
jgi:hypothetical protein